MTISRPNMAVESLGVVRQRSLSPRWSTHTTLLFALGSAAVISVLVLFLVKRSIWQELQLLVAALSAFIFAFLFFLLYRGARFDREQRWTFGWVHPRSLVEHVSSVDSLGLFSGAGGQQGIAGFLIGLLLDILVSLVLVAAIVLLLWLGINLALVAVAVIWVPLIYLFRRSVRYIVTRGRTCRGRVWRAAGWAALYTVLNAAWLYLILAIGHHLGRAGAMNGP